MDSVIGNFLNPEQCIEEDLPLIPPYFFEEQIPFILIYVHAKKMIVTTARKALKEI